MDEVPENKGMGARGGLSLNSLRKLEIIEDFTEHLRPEDYSQRHRFRKAIDNHRNYCPYATRRAREFSTYMANNFCPLGIEND